jgi:hypothetical protein
MPKKQKNQNPNRKLMKFLSLYFYLIISLTFTSCRNQKESSYSDVQVGNESAILKRTFDNKGNLVTEEILDKDSVNNGYYRKWNIGKLEFTGTYIKNKKEGSWFYMDLGGDTIKTENWFSGRKLGSQYDFFSPIIAGEAPRIYKYAFIDLYQKEVSRIEFDIDKDIVSCSGSPFYPVYNMSPLEKDSTYVLMLFWGCPKDFRFNLSIVELDEHEKIIQKMGITNNSENYDVLDFANRFVLEKKYFKTGNYKWKSVFTLSDENENIVIKDSVLIDLIVK